jgi:hypothetical protein
VTSPCGWNVARRLPSSLANTPSAQFQVDLAAIQAAGRAAGTVRRPASALHGVHGAGVDLLVGNVFTRPVSRSGRGDATAPSLARSTAPARPFRSGGDDGYGSGG